ncbi:hypothetical protein ACCUM_4001 [Candidatus Accumulibacter phosphatis]|uniref:Uncharacterized protein n=1 Tax=Candidatus Accumulibacter phosphatis TaxID=327160 RepID=A0A5S4EMU5_9PROT|nr:hypothetical protein ACCUM_4001 [Candidatus Accumulibacter phosphatis]
MGQVPVPAWLDSAGLHAYLLGHPVCSVADERRAMQGYVALVAAGRDVRLWDEALRQQIYFGDEAFVERMQALSVPQQEVSRDVPRPQRSQLLTLSQWLGSSESRAQELLCAHTQSGISMTAIAREMGLSVSYVSRLMGRAEAALQACSSVESQQTPEAAARNC